MWPVRGRRASSGKSEKPVTGLIIDFRSNSVHPCLLNPWSGWHQVNSFQSFTVVRVFQNHSPLFVEPLFGIIYSVLMVFQWKKVHWKESYHACIVRHASGTSTGPASNAVVVAGSPLPSRFIRAKLILARCSWCFASRRTYSPRYCTNYLYPCEWMEHCFHESWSFVVDWCIENIWLTENIYCIITSSSFLWLQKNITQRAEFWFAALWPCFDSVSQKWGQFGGNSIK